MSRLGRYVQETREERGLTRGQLSHMLGYRNQAKGARRITELERDGVVVKGILRKLVACLGLDSAIVSASIEADRAAMAKALEDSASERTPYLVFARPIPGVVINKEVPARYDTVETATAFARTVALHTRTEAVWLRITHREWFWVRADGAARRHIRKPGDFAPATILSGRDLGLTLREDEEGAESG